MSLTSDGSETLDVGGNHAILATECEPSRVDVGCAAWAVP